MTDSVSIVIPAYNEARRLPRTLEQLAEWRTECAFPTDILIVVEPSSDGTREIAMAAARREPNLQVLEYPAQRGKGYAVRTGVRAARGDFIFYMDTDLSVPLQEVQVFLEYFRTHPDVDVLFGNRQHPASKITRRQSRFRQTLGQGFNVVLRALGLADVRDTQCGFKAFRREAAHRIFERQQLDGFAFDIEVLLLAKRLGCRRADLPVEWINSDESKVRLVGDSVRMLWDAVRIRRMLKTSDLPASTSPNNEEAD